METFCPAARRTCERPLPGRRSRRGCGGCARPSDSTAVGAAAAGGSAWPMAASCRSNRPLVLGVVRAEGLPASTTPCWPASHAAEASLAPELAPPPPPRLKKPASLPPGRPLRGEPLAGDLPGESAPPPAASPLLPARCTEYAGGNPASPAASRLARGEPRGEDVGEDAVHTATPCGGIGPAAAPPRRGGDAGPAETESCEPRRLWAASNTEACCCCGCWRCRCDGLTGALPARLLARLPAALPPASCRLLREAGRGAAPAALFMPPLSGWHSTAAASGLRLSSCSSAANSGSSGALHERV